MYRSSFKPTQRKFLKKEETKIKQKKEKVNETRIVKLENSRWYVICKDGKRYEFETATDDFSTALNAGNALCKAMGL